MSEEQKRRDILDLSGSGEHTAPIPPENQPVRPAERPVLGNNGHAGPHKSDFLSEFLEEPAGPKAVALDATAENTDSPAADKTEDPEARQLEEDIVAALREIYDPEIPVNIYDMGLIYAVDVDSNRFAGITMTLTTPHCPVAETMPGEVELRVSGVPGVMGAEVHLVWEPAWTMEHMSDEARLELGLL